MLLYCLYSHSCGKEKPQIQDSGYLCGERKEGNLGGVMLGFFIAILTVFLLKLVVGKTWLFGLHLKCFVKKR